MKIKTFRFITRIVLSAIAFMVFEYVLLFTVNPFTIRITKTLEKGISPLGPSDRILHTEIYGDELQIINHDLTYFTTKEAKGFNAANIKITYKNNDPDQELLVGYRDELEWHYSLKPVDLPLIDRLGWTRLGSGQRILYQRDNHYSSVAEFMANPPEEPIGMYHYEPDLSSIRLSGYTPVQRTTTVPIPLRGKHTLYAYLENEPFSLQLEKQDLNWYEGDDSLTVKIYYQNELVYEKTLTDDGILTSDRTPGKLQTLQINNPGPELPESGVYKILLEASSDSIIKSFTTNLHQFVLASPVFLAGNTRSYKDLVSQTLPVSLLTNSSDVRALTVHAEGLQTIHVGTSSVSLKEVAKEETIATNSAMTTLVVPESDVIIRGDGYFAFAREQFFVPTGFSHTTTIKNTSDTENISYILTSDYYPPRVSDRWKEQEVSFTLDNAVFNNDSLSWVLHAPNLKAKNGALMIKKIEVDLFKKPAIRIPWNL